MGKNKSQTEIVAEHLEKYGTITSIEAIQKYMITRLSAVIHTLRHKRGWNIDSEERRNQNGKNWALYTLKRITLNPEDVLNENNNEQSSMFEDEKPKYKNPYESSY